MKRGLLRLPLLLTAGVFGCGGNGMHPSPTPTPPITGFGPGGFTTIKATSNTNSSLNFRLDGTLINKFPASPAISGVMHISNSPCFPFAADIPVSGMVKNNSGDSELVLTLPSGQTASFNVLPVSIFFGGSYSITGAGCATPDQGTIVGQSFMFAFLYFSNLVSKSGTSARGNLTIKSQTGPDANGFWSATGTATLASASGTAPCFSNATIDPSTTVLSGPNSQIVLVDSDPGKTGKTILTGTFDGVGGFGLVTFNGTYTSTEGACSDSGAVGMSNQ